MTKTVVPSSPVTSRSGPRRVKFASTNPTSLGIMTGIPDSAVTIKSCDGLESVFWSPCVRPTSLMPVIVIILFNQNWCGAPVRVEVVSISAENGYELVLLAPAIRGR